MLAHGFPNSTRDYHLRFCWCGIPLACCVLGDVFRALSVGVGCVGLVGCSEIWGVELSVRMLHIWLLCGESFVIGCYVLLTLVFCVD